MANVVNRFKKYITKLDTVYAQSAKTTVHDGDNELVKMGANSGEMLIPKIEMDGLGDYSRTDGYTQGDVSISYESKKCDYDRGRKFTVDSMDNEETEGILFGKLSSEFVRTKVVSELDAYRYAKYASTEGITLTSEDYTTGKQVFEAISKAQTAMDEAEVPRESRVLHITPTLLQLAKNVDLTVSKAVLDGFSEIKEVPQPRFHTAISLKNGKTDDELMGGYKPAVGAFPINFMIVDKGAVIQYVKHRVNKVIPPEENQTSDGYLFFYRAYGIAEVYENKVKGVYCSHSTTAVTE